MSVYDVGIIGLGVAGSLACLRLAKENKNIKIIAFDAGRPPLKRRSQMFGWLGCLPSSDGKFYLSDLDKVSNLIGNRKANSSFKFFNNYLNKINNYKIIKDKKINVSLEKKINKLGYDIINNDYIQMYPKDIHLLSRQMSEDLENLNNVDFKFDIEIEDINKQKNIFLIKTLEEEYKCKKVIIAVGRSGWRWASEIFSKFEIIENNDYSKFGIKVEMNSGYMKDFNKSNCSIIKENLEIGPVSWSGTIIPEDHGDLAISAFRSNENRWKTDKVSFSIIGNRFHQGKGWEQTDRLGKLSYLLSNDRIMKEKVSTILSKKSKISILPEYDWIIPVIQEFSQIVPELSNKAYFHIPTILPLVPTVNIGSNLETEIPGMFVIGESAGITGLLSAAIMGCSVSNEVVK